MVTDPLRAGIAKGPAGGTPRRFRRLAYVRIAMGSDLQACRDALKPELALYIGGDGSADLSKLLTMMLPVAGLRGGRREDPGRLPWAGAPRPSWRCRMPWWTKSRWSAAPAYQGSPAGLEGRRQAHEVGSMLLSGVTVDSLRVVARRCSEDEDRERDGSPLPSTVVLKASSDQGFVLAGEGRMSAPFIRFTSEIELTGS